MNRFRSAVLRRCKSLSRVAVGARPSPAPYSNLRSMSTRDAAVDADDDGSADGAASVAAAGRAVVLVGSSRRRYVISAEHLSHPLVAALIGGDEGRRRKGEPAAVVNCEVVLFDHLLWMLDNAADDLRGDDDGAAMRELAQLYAC
ncbi:auxin-responsive protein SAUR71 [Panicum miliaceum]|uniref:Auxin-responsive protein SAUR71 n=1 Tax=Panicum miliaceum TaxID=4540 RepID=A0A3L6T254_PANMI|nr:auxin-responsive protein SAUR71 [Panicum miliaceum]